MKTFILSILVALLGYSNTIAQDETTYGFNKGDFTISGSINYSKTNSSSEYISDIDYFSNDQNSSNLAIIPEIGYFISDHFMIGANLGYLNQHSETETISRFDQSGYIAGISGKYFFTPKKRISLFSEIATSYTKLNGDSRSFNTQVITTTGERETESFAIGLSPGINLFLNKRLSLTSRIGRIGYEKTKGNAVNQDNNSTSSFENDRFVTSIGLDNFYFGVLYRI
ncbi:outer membrane beta-barrel protein [uncultured Aquimarina sp.]|uniref:outer membrane beta-barrel protein n=1 Tax=uncultured Aquimarina sp. TaxID=575652 RepID=UPI0026045159|nr:outer membrane beta-barrel protein [uncultured Aquimarina sp.]